MNGSAFIVYCLLLVLENAYFGRNLKYKYNFRSACCYTIYLSCILKLHNHLCLTVYHTLYISFHILYLFFVFVVAFFCNNQHNHQHRMFLLSYKCKCKLHNFHTYFLFFLFCMVYNLALFRWIFIIESILTLTCWNQK